MHVLLHVDARDHTLRDREVITTYRLPEAAAEVGPPAERVAAQRSGEGQEARARASTAVLVGSSERATVRVYARAYEADDCHEVL